MMRIADLFRYPIKGFTRERCDFLDVLPGGRIAGDRVLGLRYHNAQSGDDAWGTKLEFTALINTPALTSLRVGFDPGTQRAIILLGDAVLFDDALDAAGRERFALAVEQYLGRMEDASVVGHPERLPLKLVGNGVTPRYQDREPGYVTLHGRASLATLAARVGEDAPVTEQRFRSNIAVEGLEAWEEQRWVGGSLRIGDVTFSVVNPVTRCLATHANPKSGTRDLPIMKTLLQLFPAERPTFAVLMTSTLGGRIRVGDRVSFDASRSSGTAAERPAARHP